MAVKSIVLQNSPEEVVDFLALMLERMKGRIPDELVSLFEDAHAMCEVVLQATVKSVAVPKTTDGPVS